MEEEGEEGQETKNNINSESGAEEDINNDENINSRFFGATSNNLEPPTIDEYINDKGGTYKTSEEKYVWEDRAIHFDVGKGTGKSNGIALRQGEYIIDSLPNVEDTKGYNTGVRGTLVVTNLRLYWVSSKDQQENLSIGHFCLLQQGGKVTIRKAKSRLRGMIQALHIIAKEDDTKFEFIFTSAVESDPLIFQTIQNVIKIYDASSFYRELKLRCSILRSNQLILLKKEEEISKINGVWNLSINQGNIGTLTITNIRVVWNANLAHNFNVSIPYMQIREISVKLSKYGPAIVLHTTPHSGGYMLGFRIDPPEKLLQIYEEIVSLYKIYAINPIFGVEYQCMDEMEEKKGQMQTDGENGKIKEGAVLDGEDYLQTHIIDDYYSDRAAAYYADQNKITDRPIIFDQNFLGLAIETPPPNETLQSLWRVV